MNDCIIIPRRELTEDSIAEINRVLIDLSIGSLVTAVYYCDPEQDYLQLTGYVKNAIQTQSMYLFLTLLRPKNH